MKRSIKKCSTKKHSTKKRSIKKRSIKKQKLKKSRTRKNRGRKPRKTMRGGVEFPDIKLPETQTTNIVLNTTSYFLKQLFASTDGKYEKFNTTKYHFGNYENMIASLKYLMQHDIEGVKPFEDTILDAILKLKTEQKELPALIKIIGSLKLTSSNIAYFFTKNPQEKLNTPIIELVPEYIKNYINKDNATTRKLEDVLKVIISPLIDDAATEKSYSIVEQLKRFVMKSDYEGNVQDGWYLSTILLELITNVLTNLDLTHSKLLLTFITDSNKEQLFTCELVNYLITRNGLNEETGLNLYKLYRSIDQQVKNIDPSDMIVDYDHTKYDYDHTKYNNYTILDFFDKAKNAEGILPPFILLLLSFRINPDVNIITSKFKDSSLFNLLTSGCKITPGIADAVRATTRITAATTRPIDTTDEGEGEGEEFFDIVDDPEDDQEGGIKIPWFGTKEKADEFVEALEKVDTTCTADSTFGGRIAGKILINPIYTKICEDINGKTLSWNSFNAINSIVSKAHVAETTHLLDISLICYMLAPYSTFFPLDIKRYIEDHILNKGHNKAVFKETINRYEDKLIKFYKTHTIYDEPLCPPISIMNEVIKPKSK